MIRFVFGVVLLVICLCWHGIAGSVNKKCGIVFMQRYLEKMESKQDVNISPCDDFYTHACGNWDTTYRLRQLGASDTLSSIKAENKLLLIKHFDSTINKGTLNTISIPKCLNDFYTSCIDRQFADGSNSVRNYADELLRIGDWPILSPNFMENKERKSFNWESISGQLRRYGTNSLWRTLVQPNWQNAEQLIVYIAPPAFEFLQRTKRTARGESLQNDENNSNESDEAFLYKTYVKYLLFDMDVRVRKALSLADEIVRFEQDLIALTADDDNSVVLTAPQTLESLVSQFPGIRLKLFFDALFENVELPKKYGEKLLVVADKDYLRKLSNLLKQTNEGTIANYLMVQFFVHFEVRLHDDLLYSARQEHCLHQANSFLPKELSRLFLDLQHDGNGIEFLESAHHNLNKIFNNLKDVFESLIKDTNVFNRNSNTRVEGLEKLYLMDLKLPHLTNDSSCEAVGPGTTLLLSDNYDLNLIYLSRLRTHQELIDVISTLVNVSDFGSNIPSKSSFQPDNREDTSSYGPLNVNAYYRLKKNAIEIPIGLLSLPIYDDCLETPIIYGSIAFIIGHELMHGFDYDGLNYDKTGNIVDGWDPKSIIDFGTKASCYLKARYENAHTNVNENIADSEGMRLALGALQKLIGPLQSETLKMFFTSFAQIWCRALSVHTEHHTVHAGNRERVNNVLANFQEFAEAFQCKPGSVLNPAEKCHVW